MLFNFLSRGIYRLSTPKRAWRQKERGGKELAIPKRVLCDMYMLLYTFLKAGFHVTSINKLSKRTESSSLKCYFTHKDILALHDHGRMIYIVINTNMDKHITVPVLEIRIRNWSTIY